MIKSNQKKKLNKNIFAKLFMLSITLIAGITFICNQTCFGMNNDNEPDLFRLVIKNDLSGIEKFLEGKSDDQKKEIFTKKYNDSQETLVYKACKNNNLKMLQKLLELGAKISINITDRDNRTPLFCANSNGNYEMAKLLLDNGAKDSINTIYNINGSLTPLSDAYRMYCFLEDPDDAYNIAKDNAETNAKDNFKPEEFEKNKSKIIDELKNNYFKLAELFLSHGANPNIPEFDLPLLHSACRFGHKKWFQLFLKYDPEKEDAINKKCKDYNTPLYYACEIDNLEAVKFLLEKGAKVDEESISITNENKTYNKTYPNQKYNKPNSSEILKLLEYKKIIAPFSANNNKENVMSPDKGQYLDCKIKLNKN